MVQAGNDDRIHFYLEPYSIREPLHVGSPGFLNQYGIELGIAFYHDQGFPEFGDKIIS